MKKFIYVFIILSLILIPTISLNASSSHYLDIKNFTFKAEPIIGKDGISEITFNWNCAIKMDDFRITIFDSNSASFL